MNRTVDLNCDAGELEGDIGLRIDELMTQQVTSINVACGAHAGDAKRMQELAAFCRKHGVAFGAHPGFADREHFGRKTVPMTASELRELIIAQLWLAARIADSADIRLSHVKPHGALYNLASVNADTAAVLVDAVASITPAASLFALSGTLLETLARQSGLAVVSEAFADRTYDNQGQLVDRSIPGSVLCDPDQIAIRAVAMVHNQAIRSSEGITLPRKIQTLCIHGDTPEASLIASTVRVALLNSGVEVRHPS